MTKKVEILYTALQQSDVRKDGSDVIVACHDLAENNDKLITILDYFENGIIAKYDINYAGLNDATVHGNKIYVVAIDGKDIHLELFTAVPTVIPSW